MIDPNEPERRNQSPRSLQQPPLRSQGRDEATLRRSMANANPGNIGFAYSAPEYGADPEEPVTRLGLVWRIVASAVLAVFGVNAVVQIIRMLAQAEPAWVAALGMAVVAALTLAYPIVNLVRWVRAMRRSRRKRTA